MLLPSRYYISRQILTYKGWNSEIWFLFIQSIFIYVHFFTNGKEFFIQKKRIDIYIAFVKSGFNIDAFLFDYIFTDPNGIFII